MRAGFGWLLLLSADTTTAAKPNLNFIWTTHLLNLSYTATTIQTSPEVPSVVVCPTVGVTRTTLGHDTCTCINLTVTCLSIFSFLFCSQEEASNFLTAHFYSLFPMCRGFYRTCNMFNKINFKCIGEPHLVLIYVFLFCICFIFDLFQTESQSIFISTALIALNYKI